MSRPHGRLFFALFSPEFYMKTVSLRSSLALVLTTGLTTLTLSTQAQTASYVNEALSYSRLQFGGPARTQGIAGANVALGADFGNLSSNPAGLGLYQKSEFHFAPGVGFGSADASATSGSLTANKNSFHIASAGVIFTNRHPDNDSQSGWRGGSFGLGFTRQADFNQSFQYTNQATDANSFFQSLREPGGNTDYTSAAYQAAVADIAEQERTGNYTSLEGLAYGSFLTGIRKVPRPGGGGDLSIIDAPHTKEAITQHELVTNKGSLSQFDLAYGGSYRDQLYVGGGVGIVSLNQERTSTFSESSGGAQDFETTDALKTTGTGINARLGLIYRAADMVRLGASIQTPTYIRLTDTYSTSLTVNQDFLPAGSTLSNSLSTAPGTYSYNLVTPFRANGGVAVLLNKYGFLTGDVEYVGYSQARYSNNPNDSNGDNYTFTAENQGIKQVYRNTVNLRFGAEGRFDIFRARLGYATYGDPYVYRPISRAQQFYTAGLGLRQNSFFFDLAGVYTTFNQQHSSYTLASGQQPIVNVNNNRFTATVTAGLTF